MVDLTGSQGAELRSGSPVTVTAMAERRMLLVHAHPDDETITTGATMAHYSAAGALVTLVTCTLGEQGEILVPALAGLEAERADQLGGYRMSELAAALRALGVIDHRYLGGPGAFRDSGMRGAPSAAHPRAFARAAVDPVVFDTAVAALVAIVREVRPHVVITYDENGDYGHPDHVLAHRVTTAAVDAAARADVTTAQAPPAGGSSEPWTVPKVYWTATTHSSQERDYAAATAAQTGTAASLTFTAVPPGELDHGVDDALVTAVVDASSALPAKTVALAAHRTQILLDGGLYALSNLQGKLVSGVECYRLARGAPGGVLDEFGHETDLFGGLP